MNIHDLTDLYKNMSIIFFSAFAIFIGEIIWHCFNKYKIGKHRIRRLSTISNSRKQLLMENMRNINKQPYGKYKLTFFIVFILFFVTSAQWANSLTSLPLQPGNKTRYITDLI